MTLSINALKSAVKSKAFWLAVLGSATLVIQNPKDITVIITAISTLGAAISGHGSK